MVLNNSGDKKATKLQSTSPKFCAQASQSDPSKRIGFSGTCMDCAVRDLNDALR